MDNKEYFIVLHNVPHEIQLYIEELKEYGEITHRSERYPTQVWLSSYWDMDIIQSAMGVKQVYPKRFSSIPVSVIHDRNWTELLGTKWELNPA